MPPAQGFRAGAHGCLFEVIYEWLWEWCEQDAQGLHYKYKAPVQELELWEADRSALLKLPEYPSPEFRPTAFQFVLYRFATSGYSRFVTSSSRSGCSTHSDTAQVV